MNKKYYYIIIPLAYLMLALGTFFVSKKMFFPSKIHNHAGFIVFQNNNKLDFSDGKYMYIKPCSLNPNHNGTNNKQLEKAHLHENIGDLVHVEEKGAIWKDLFTNIGFSIDYAKLIGYINGKKVSNFQAQPIHPYESLVLFIDNNNPNLIKQAVAKDYILKMEKNSTACGD